MLCPNCLRETTFTGTPPHCPECQLDVPVLYARDYDEYAPAPLSLVGWSGHGKTVYLTSLLYQLELLGEGWRQFRWSPASEEDLAYLRHTLTPFGKGTLPQTTPKVLPRPVVIRLTGVPKLGQRQLLIYDTGGETFENSTNFVEFGKYVGRSPSVLWLLSMSDVHSPDELMRKLTVYRNSVVSLEGDPTQQDLVVVLTKGDLIEIDEEAPKELHRFLGGDLDAQVLSLGDWKKLSRTLGDWLEDKPLYRNFIREVRAGFRSVYFCVVSATGSPADGLKLKVTPTPRAVIQPVLLTMALAEERDGSRSLGRAFRKFSGGGVAPEAEAPTAARRTDGAESSRTSVPSPPDGFRVPWGVLLMFALVIGGIALTISWLNGHRAAASGAGAAAAAVPRELSFHSASFGWDVPSSWFLNEESFRPDRGQVRHRWTWQSGELSMFAEVVSPDDGATSSYIQQSEQSWVQTPGARYERVRLTSASVSGRSATQWEFVLLNPRRDPATKHREYLYTTHNGDKVVFGFVAPPEQFASARQQFFEPALRSVRWR